jgi:hypothetical protein
MTVNLPAVRFQLSRPFLVDSVSVSRAGNRATSFIEYADPYWQIDMKTKPLSGPELALVEAFRAQARTGMVTVLFKPVDMCLPQAYWGNASATAVVDDGNLVSVTNGTTVAMNGVTTGLIMKPGDRFSLTKGDYRSMHEVVTGATAAGGAITLAVDPPVPPYITAGAVAKFKNPELNMRVLPGSFAMPDDHRPVASFSLVEVPK